jgi:hypothetical protein
MSRLKPYLFLLFVSLAFKGCASSPPLVLDTHLNGSTKVLLAPTQIRSAFLEPRNILGAPPQSSREATRPVLTVSPSAVSFLSQSHIMITQHRDGTIGLRNLGALAARPGRSEQARLANPFESKSSLLSPALAYWLFPSCPIPD